VWEQLRQKKGDKDFFAGLADFFSKYRLKTVTYKDFLQCLKSKTSVNVEEYLGQWIRHNAIIDLSINNVSIQKKGDFYISEVEILVDSNRDYELFSSIGYKTSPEDVMGIIDLHTIKKGIHYINLHSKEKPIFIQVDPAYQVPQINLDNNIWRQ
jgi:aminopeptidase N